MSVLFCLHSGECATERGKVVRKIVGEGEHDGKIAKGFRESQCKGKNGGTCSHRRLVPPHHLHVCVYLRRPCNPFFLDGSVFLWVALINGLCVAAASVGHTLVHVVLFVRTGASYVHVRTGTIWRWRQSMHVHPVLGSNGGGNGHALCTFRNSYV